MRQQLYRRGCGYRWPDHPRAQNPDRARRPFLTSATTHARTLITPELPAAAPTHHHCHWESDLAIEIFAALKMRRNGVRFPIDTTGEGNPMASRSPRFRLHHDFSSGNAVILSFAEAYGTKVIFSAGSLLEAGL